MHKFMHIYQVTYLNYFVYFSYVTQTSVSYMRKIENKHLKLNLIIIFTSLPIDKPCCLGLIERKPKTDSSQYTVIGKYNLRTILLHSHWRK